MNTTSPSFWHTGVSIVAGFMDYRILTEFRQLSQRVLSAGFQVRAEDVQKLRAHAVTLGPSACAYELGFFPSICERLHLSRYFPESHRHAVLTSPSVLPLSGGRQRILLKRPSDVSRIAAQFASLSFAWRDDTRPSVKRALSDLGTRYDFILRTKPQAAELPVSLHSLISRAKDALSASQDLTCVVAEGDSLLPVDEGLHAQWAVIRAVFTNLGPVLAKATKLALIHDISDVDSFRAKCDAFRTHVFNRDVELPSLDTPLGKGVMTRMSAQISPHLRYLFENTERSGGNSGGEADDDDDDIEWEDEIELVSSRPDPRPLQIGSDDDMSERASSPAQSKTVQVEHPPWLSDATSSRIQTKGFIPSVIGKNDLQEPGPSRGSDGSSKIHNKTILAALDASLQTERQLFSSPHSQATNKKRTTARDRLSAKLGIKKKQRRGSCTLSRCSTFSALSSRK